MRDLGVSGKEKNHQGRNTFRKLVFYGISLLLSLLVIVTSTTVYFVISFVEGGPSWFLFYLYLAVMTCNLLIAGVSIAGAFRSYMDLEKTASHVVFAVNVNPGSAERPGAEPEIPYLTALESELQLQGEAHNRYC